MADLEWVIQKGIIGSRDYERLTEAIRCLGHTIHDIQIVPFVHEAAGSIPRIEGPCLVYGSSGLLSFARKQGWSPAGWDGPEFEVTALISNLGGLALNADARETVLASSVRIAREHGWDRVFIRPNSETKAFAGQVLDLTELESWIALRLSADESAGNDLRVILAPARQVALEWRLFVVAGRVVAASQYAEGGNPALAAGVPEDVIVFGNAILRLYQPAPAFVLDVAEVHAGMGRELRVVEVNSINSSGFYKCDVQAVIRALSELVHDGAYRVPDKENPGC